eukprot:14385820-Alexandrium_andersonii.AAC.1
MEYGQPWGMLLRLRRVSPMPQENSLKTPQGLDIGHVPNNHRHGVPGGDESARQDHPVDLIEAFPKVNS